MNFNVSSENEKEPICSSMTGRQVLERLKKITIHQNLIDDIYMLSEVPPDIRHIIIAIANKLNSNYEDNIHDDEHNSTIIAGWHFDEDNNLVPDH